MGTKIQISPDDTILWPPGKPSPAMGIWRREMRELGFDPDTWRPLEGPSFPREIGARPKAWIAAAALAGLAIAGILFFS